MKDYQFYKTLCRNILKGKFNQEKYYAGKDYYGRYIETQYLHCSYGTIGFVVTVEHDVEVKYDGEMGELTIDEKPYKIAINLMYLELNDINPTSDECVWDEHPDSVELECYTDGGEDMLIALESPTKEGLQQYIDNFDINENVMLWWRNGLDAAHNAGVPYDNIKDHYTDYEVYLKWLQRICNAMPY